MNFDYDMKSLYFDIFLGYVEVFFRLGNFCCSFLKIILFIYLRFVIMLRIGGIFFLILLWSNCLLYGMVGRRIIFINVIIFVIKIKNLKLLDI